MQPSSFAFRRTASSSSAAKSRYKKINGWLRPLDHSNNQLAVFRLGAEFYAAFTFGPPFTHRIAMCGALDVTVPSVAPPWHETVETLLTDTNSSIIEISLRTGSVRNWIFATTDCLRHCMRFRGGLSLFSVRFFGCVL